MSDVQADIPQQGEEIRELVPTGIAVIAEQKQEIDVGIRAKLASPISAWCATFIPIERSPGDEV